MTKNLLLILCGLFFLTAKAQYNPGIFNYGFSLINTSETSVWGGGIRAEYAHNCYTTFLGELNYLHSNKDPYAEFAAGVNLILFNFYPTTITAGVSYIVNNDNNFKEFEDEAFLVFPTANLNHGAQIKLRGLQRLSATTHLFAEVNLKSLGINYHSFSIGMNYNFGVGKW